MLASTLARPFLPDLSLLQSLHINVKRGGLSPSTRESQDLLAHSFLFHLPSLWASAFKA